MHDDKSSKTNKDTSSDPLTHQIKAELVGQGEISDEDEDDDDDNYSSDNLYQDDSNKQVDKNDSDEQYLMQIEKEINSQISGPDHQHQFTYDNPRGSTTHAMMP